MNDETFSCSICLNDNLDIINGYLTQCNHIFCKQCFNDWLSNNNYTCPMCRSTIKKYRSVNNIYNMIYINNQNTQNDRNTLINNMNGNLLTENLRLKSFSLGLLLLLIFAGNYIIIMHYNYNYMLEKYNDYYNCSLNYCKNDIYEICS